MSNTQLPLFDNHEKMIKKIGFTILGIFLFGGICFAFSGSDVLPALEQTYSQASEQSKMTAELLKRAEDSHAKAQVVCLSSYTALKAFKESQGIALQGGAPDCF